MQQRFFDLGELITALQARIQYIFKGRPGRHLNIVAVTGIAGKTTTTHLLHHLFTQADINVGVISSEGTFVRGKMLNNIPVDRLDPTTLYEILNELLQQQVSIVILETPVSLIRRQALAPLHFSATILTNILTPYLISDRPELEKLAETIFVPLVQTQEEGLAIIDGDDPNVGWISGRAEKLKQRLYAAWCKQEHVQDWKQSWQGMSFQIYNTQFQSPLCGSFNFHNLMLAIRFGLQYLPIEKIAAAVTTFPGVPGRMQVIQTAQSRVVIDGAKEPVLVNIVLGNIQQLKFPESRLISLIGADNGDQAAVGSLAVKNSKIIISVPQNPGDNDLSTLNNKLISAAEQRGAVLVERFGSAEEFEISGKEKLSQKIDRVIQNGDVPFVVFDDPSPLSRSNGIRLALSLAKSGDTILLQGKGADHSMRFGEIEYDWKEGEVVRSLLGEVVS